MFDQFYGMEILSVSAYGVDEFDFTPNPLGFGASIGQTGYAVFEFQNGNLYFSTDGLTTELPSRKNVHALSAENLHRDLVGAVVVSIQKRAEKDLISYEIQLSGYPTISCYFENSDGCCDRNYFSIDVFGYEP